MLWGAAAVGVALTAWAAADCFRNEADRGPWLAVILAAPGVGPAVYLLARWLPPRLGTLRRFGGRRELRRLRWEAETIGNPHQFVRLGEALLDRRRPAEAREAFERAAAADRGSLPARWGAARAAYAVEDFASAREHVGQVLAADERYRFGDASLLLGRCLNAEGREAEALLWMTRHVERWRQPEGLMLLATIQKDGGLNDAAAGTMRELLGELDHAPPAVARRHAGLRRRARRLLRRVESKS